MTTTLRRIVATLGLSAGLALGPAAVAEASVNATASRPTLSTYAVNSKVVNSNVSTYGTAGHYHLVRRSSTGSKVIGAIEMGAWQTRLVSGPVTCSPYYVEARFYVRHSNGTVISPLSDPMRCA